MQSSLLVSYCAEVAELADALDSGSSGRKAMGVQVPPSAPTTYIKTEGTEEGQKSDCE